MNSRIRRRLLATVAGTGLGFGAGCLNTGSESDDDTGSEPDRSIRVAPEDWVGVDSGIPAYGYVTLGIRYTDFDSIRRHESARDPDTADQIPDTVGQIQTARGQDTEYLDLLGTPASEVSEALVLASGENSSGVVLGGSFDSAAVDDRLQPTGERGEFEIFTVDDESGAATGADVAIAPDTAVIAAESGPAIEDWLATGVDGASRRVDDDPIFGALLAQFDQATLMGGSCFFADPETPPEHPEVEGHGLLEGMVWSWSLGRDRTTLTVARSSSSQESPETDTIETLFEDGDFGTELLDVTIETEGPVAVGSGTLATDSFEFVTPMTFYHGQEPSDDPPRATVTMDVDRDANTVTAVCTTLGGAARVDLRIGQETVATLEEAGAETTITYEEGQGELITAVSIADDGTETNVAVQELG